MEYCGAGSLSDLMMKGKFTLREDEIRFVISQVLLGIAFLHDQSKIHRVGIGAMNDHRISRQVTFYLRILAMQS